MGPFWLDVLILFPVMIPPTLALVLVVLALFREGADRARRDGRDE